MTPDRRKQIEKLYYATTELEVSRRAAFLDEAWAGDEELRLQIASLLASDAQAGSFRPSPPKSLSPRQSPREQVHRVSGARSVTTS
jgi:hypothetical protein